MYKITNKQLLSPGVKRLDVYAPNISAKAKPGHFVNVCPDKGSEHIPLTIIDADQTKQTIALIFKEVGQTTRRLGELTIDESIYSILGPLGVTNAFEKKGEVICVATGVGIAQMLPICRALKSAGNKVTGVVGALTKRDLILEPQMRIVCDKLLMATNDGSYEHKGNATDVFAGLILKRKVNAIYAIGSVAMMQEISQLTLAKQIPTRVYLNSVMLDCTGMCGACRVIVNGRTVLSCLEGPEFDGHQVDFEDLKIRMNAYKENESWHSPMLQSSRQRNAPEILTKFLLGILKK